MTKEAMSVEVALDFADNPRPYHTLQAPADTNGELYEALAVLASSYRAAAMAADKARIVELEGVLNNLAMAAGELNVATDGQDAIMSQRSAVLEALFDTRATLTSEADNADG